MVNGHLYSSSSNNAHTGLSEDQLLWFEKLRSTSHKIQHYSALIPSIFRKCFNCLTEVSHASTLAITAKTAIIFLELWAFTDTASFCVLCVHRWVGVGGVIFSALHRSHDQVWRPQIGNRMLWLCTNVMLYFRLLSFIKSELYCRLSLLWSSFLIIIA